MASSNVVKGQGRDVVGLAFANQRVVLEKILLFGLIALGLSVEDSLSFGSVKGGRKSAVPMPSFANYGYTYSEMSSNSIFTPNASLASAASKGPEINLGPEVALAVIV